MTEDKQAIAPLVAGQAPAAVDIASRSKMRIGSLDYSLEELSGFRDYDGTKLNGRVQHTECSIVVEANMPEQAKYQTLWHEVLHAIANHAGRDSSEEITHSLLDMFAHGICTTLRDNPWLGVYPL